MGSGFSRTFTPDAANAEVYNGLYEKYQQLGKTLDQQRREL